MRKKRIKSYQDIINNRTTLENQINLTNLKIGYFEKMEEKTSDALIKLEEFKKETETEIDDMNSNLKKKKIL